MSSKTNVQRSRPDRAFGDWLRECRKARGVTQDRLAELARCSVQMIRKLEAGEARPSPDLAVRITNALVPSSPPAGEPVAPPFGTWLRRLRQAQNLTQAELAEQVGCSLSAIKRMEQGRLRPSHDLAERLAGELAIPPHEHTAWFARARTLDSTEGAAPPARRTNLPPVVLPPIGRDAEMAQARAALAQDGIRLVTLTGPAGIGKTRLALHTAAGLDPAFPDGIWWVPLATLTDPALLETTISRALGLHDGAGPPDVSRLRPYLRVRRLLLVLDNFEHLLVATPVLADLLASAPGLRLLVTSQAPPELAGAVVIHLPPLAVPPLPPPPLPDLQAYPAMQLFLQEARVADAAFQLTTDNAALLTAICHRLEGLPLAIELAAARSRLIAPEAILAGLAAQPLDLLAEDSVERPLRLQALRHALAWSVGLLQAADQVLFAGLGIFAGGITLAAVTRLVPPLLAAAGLPSGEAAVVQRGLERLLAHHLVRREDENDTTRLMLLETVRAFAREQLQARQLLDLAATHHAQYYLAQAERRAGPPLPVELDQLDQIEGDLDNYRAALDWTLAAPDRRPLAIRLALALAEFWQTRGYWQEGQHWLMRVLDQPDTLPDPQRVHMEYHAGRMAYLRGDYATAEPLLQRSLAAGQRQADNQIIAWAGNALGWLNYMRTAYRQARAYFEEALPAARAADPRTAAGMLNGLGGIALGLGDQPAEPLLAESLALRQAQGDQQGIARSLNALGLAAHARADYPRAIEHFQASLALARTLGDKLSIALALTNLGWEYLAAGNLGEAQVYLSAALGQAREIGSPASIMLAQCALGWLAVLRGDLEQAGGLLDEGVEAAKTQGMTQFRIIGYLGQALLALHMQNLPLAGSRLDEALTLVGQLGTGIPPYEYETALRIARATGRALSPQFGARPPSVGI